MDMCKNLIEWFKELNLDVPHSNIYELSSGTAFAVALNQFAPETFSGLLMFNGVLKL